MDREFKYTVKVKSYVPYHVDDATINMIGQDAFDRLVEQTQHEFWIEAKEVAIRHGFTDVWSEGRMGGWCTPTLNDYNGHTKSISHYLQAGYGEDREVEIETQFDHFKAAIESLLSDFEEEFKAEVEWLYEYEVSALKTRQDNAIVLGYN